MRFFLGQRNTSCHERGQQADNRDDHEQFGQREGLMFVLAEWDDDHKHRTHLTGIAEIHNPKLTVPGPTRRGNDILPCCEKSPASDHSRTPEKSLPLPGARGRGLGWGFHSTSAITEKISPILGSFSKLPGWIPFSFAARYELAFA